MRTTPYITFDGQCAEAFRFYAQVLGGEIVFMQTHGESPIADQVPPDWHDRVMHASLKAGDAELMASDGPPGRHEPPAGVHVSLHVDSVEDADRIFHALAEGGSVTMPIEQTFWARRFGMATDRYGVPWMINCE